MNVPDRPSTRESSTNPPAASAIATASSLASRNVPSATFTRMRPSRTIFARSSSPPVSACPKAASPSAACPRPASYWASASPSAAPCTCLSAPKESIDQPRHPGRWPWWGRRPAREPPRPPAARRLDATSVVGGGELVRRVLDHEADGPGEHEDRRDGGQPATRTAAATSAAPGGEGTACRRAGGPLEVALERVQESDLALHQASTSVAGWSPRSWSRSASLRRPRLTRWRAATSPHASRLATSV